MATLSCCLGPTKYTRAVLNGMACTHDREERERKREKKKEQKREDKEIERG